MTAGCERMHEQSDEMLNPINLMICIVLPTKHGDFPCVEYYQRECNLPKRWAMHQQAAEVTVSTVVSTGGINRKDSGDVRISSGWWFQPLINDG